MFHSLSSRRILLGALMVSAFAWVGSVKAGRPESGGDQHQSAEGHSLGGEREVGVG